MENTVQCSLCNTFVEARGDINELLKIHCRYLLISSPTFEVFVVILDLQKDRAKFCMSHKVIILDPFETL